MDKKQIAKMIDHAVLHPSQGKDALVAECKIADKYGVASVCVKPYMVKEASELLKYSDVMVGTVIGFPHGNSSIPVKVYEAQQACRDGAVEVDMVVNNGKVTDGDWEYVFEEIDSVNKAVLSENGIVKVIFETSYLSDEAIVKLCEICTKANVAFVKTSTGFGFVKTDSGDMKALGATSHHIKLMRENSGDALSVKASGGIKSVDDIVELYNLGATRFGTSSTAIILEGLVNDSSY